MELYGKIYTKEQIRENVGHISQIAGVKSYILNQGREKGCEAFDVYNGIGLNFTILVDRCMDIYSMNFQGKGISYITKSGISSSKYYTAQGFEWLRNFGGGGLTTCGLTQVGPPETDGIWNMGLHGRISNSPAFDVSNYSEWQGDEYVMTLQGSMREAVLYEENLVLRRTITSVAGKNIINITDVVENQGAKTSPFMLLYHMNFGFPLLSENTRLLLPSIKVTANDSYSEQYLQEYNIFYPPSDKGGTQLFFHEMLADKDDNVKISLYNEKLEYGVYIKYNKRQLPYFSQWKNTSYQDYVIGLEPGNCLPLGRKENKEKGILQYLKPNQSVKIDLVIGIL